MTVAGPPFPPGQSPFRIKGMAYRGHMKYAAERLPGGVAAMLDGLDDPALRAFFEQSFLAASWYDILPLLPAGRVCARLAGTSYEEYLVARSRWQAASDMTGVYKMLIKVASTQSVALRLPKLLQRYLDFGGTVATAVEPGLVEAETRGMPRAVLAWFAPVAATYTVCALELGGAPGARVVGHPAEPDGSAHGVDLVRYRWDVCWS